MPFVGSAFISWGLPSVVHYIQVRSLLVYDLQYGDNETGLHLIVKKVGINTWEMVIIKWACCPVWAKRKIDNMDRKYAALQNEPDQISSCPMAPWQINFQKWQQNLVEIACEYTSVESVAPYSIRLSSIFIYKLIRTCRSKVMHTETRYFHLGLTPLGLESTMYNTWDNHAITTTPLIRLSKEDVNSTIFTQTFTRS